MFHKQFAITQSIKSARQLILTLEINVAKTRLGTLWYIGANRVRMYSRFFPWNRISHQQYAHSEHYMLCPLTIQSLCNIRYDRETMYDTITMTRLDTHIYSFRWKSVEICYWENNISLISITGNRLSVIADNDHVLRLELCDLDYVNYFSVYI